jgi:hypothetical protein
MTFVIPLLLSLLPAPQAPQAPPAARLTDQQVKELLTRIDDERDRFEDKLDGNVKHTVLRGPAGEVDVERFLDDLQENVDKLKGRFEDDYSAGSEVATVLRQGSAVQRHMSTQPPNMKGASEWNRLASSLNELAAVYGTTFPLTEGAAVRRIGDHEIAAAASKTADAADHFRKQLDAAMKQDTTFSLAAREAAVAEAKGLKEDAEELAERLRDNKPASGEATALLQRAQRIQASGASRPLPDSAKAAWSDVVGPLSTIAQGFNMPPPR